MADRPPLDLHPLVRQVKSLLYGVADETLAAPTPCPGWRVGDLLDHVSSLALAFTRAARKTAGAADGGPPPAPSVANLHRQWRSRLPPQLDDLADAWADPDAWTGTAHAGGVTLPADQLGLFAANELTMHGWDLARATGQDFAVDPRVLEILIGFLSQLPAEGTPGLFGPVVEAGDEEPSLLARAVALAGRDPGWRH
ncbi:MAG TPA: TIGR03086 family metal-binding protein [Actinoplanes sp.]